MDGEHDLAASRRLSSLAEKFHDKRYRDGYVAAHTRGVLARQMRNFRGDLSQGEFGELIGKRQTVVSRLENPSYGAWQLRTMFEIARKLGVAVFARFVDFPTFLRYSGDMSNRALCPQSYSATEVDQFVGSYERAMAQWTSLTMMPPTGNDVASQGWTLITVTQGSSQTITIGTTGIAPYFRAAANISTSAIRRSVNV